MDYKDFKNDLLIAVDFGELGLEEIEESIQEWYITYKQFPFSNIINFCKEQIPTDRDNSTLWLSNRGIAILEIRHKLDNIGPKDVFPVFGKSNFDMLG